MITGQLSLLRAVQPGVPGRRQGGPVSSKLQVSVIQGDLGALIQGSVIAGSTRETPPVAVDVHRSAKMLQG